MKKSLKILLTLGLATTMLFVIVAFSGCSPRRHPHSDPAIGRELEIRIRQDYAASRYTTRSIDSISIYRYYGTFSNASVVIFNPAATVWQIWQEIVAEIVFDTPCSGMPIRVWHAGEFYTLTQAYDNVWLTVYCLIIIAEKNDAFWYDHPFWS